MSQVVVSLDAARQAAAAGRWRDAHASYAETDPTVLGPQDLEAYAEAAWWTCRADQAIELRERAYGAFLAESDPLGAARVATQLSFAYQGRGAFAVANGWLARAERLLADLPESRERAQLLLFRGMGLLDAGMVEQAQAELQQAQEMAVRLGDRDIESIALVVQGRVLVLGGDVDRGLALLDETSATALSGELRPFAAGLVYCCTISSCQDVGDYRRAAEWTNVANRFCDRIDVSGFPGACRVHRAQVLRLQGNWTAAEEQAITACEELHDYDYWGTGDGLYEVGEIRRRRGDFAAALESYRRADELGRDPQPGLALLRLAEGKVDAALAAVRRTLDGVTEPLQRLQQLPAQVEIALAAGELRTAHAAAEEMAGIVTAYKIASQVAPAFDAQVHLANGQIQLAEGDLTVASRSLRRARAEWRRVDAPYEVAKSRMLLGIAYRRQGDEDGAMTEFDAALAVFERLGAQLDAEQVKELLGRLETRRTFLFTDIVGSTQLLQTLGDDKWRKLLARHDQLLRDRIVETGGEVIKQTGDGFFASFDQPKAALHAAAAIHRALDAETFAPDVRIGVHTGGAFHPDGDPTDYAGQGVHVAARVGAAAGAGETLVSRETLDGLGGAFALSEPREITLKGFAVPVSVVSVDWH